MTSPSPGSRTAGWQAVIHRHTAREAVGVRRGGPDRSFRAHRRWRPRRSICPAPSSIRWSSQQRVRHQRRRQIAGDRHQATDLRRRGGRRGDVARGPARRHRLSSGPAMSTTANFIPPRGAPRLCAPCSSRATSITPASRGEAALEGSSSAPPPHRHSANGRRCADHPHRVTADGDG